MTQKHQSEMGLLEPGEDVAYVACGEVYSAELVSDFNVGLIDTGKEETLKNAVEGGLLRLGAKLNEIPKRKRGKITCDQILKELKRPEIVASFFLKAVTASGPTALVFAMMVTLVLVSKGPSSGSILVSSEQRSESEITEEMIANAIPSSPSVLPPSNLAALGEAVTNAPPTQVRYAPFYRR